MNPLGGTCSPSTICTDSVVLGTTFHCATTGCTPEYYNWAIDLDGDTLWVSGDAITPAYSRYSLRQIPADVCLGTEDTCAESGESVLMTTGIFGDANGSSTLSVVDVAATIDKIKDIPTGSVILPLAMLQPNVPNPSVEVNVLDLAAQVGTHKDVPFHGLNFDSFAGPAACPK
jgi:hypothetical protein